MLKHRINRTNVINDTDKIKVISNTIDDLKIGDDLVNAYNDKLLVTCYTNDVSKLASGVKLLTYNYFVLTNNDLMTTNSYTVQGVYTISGVNEIKKSFTFSIEKFFKIESRVISKVKIIEPNGDTSGKEYLYVYFASPHFFEDAENVYEDDSEESVTHDFYFNYVDRSGTVQFENLKMEFVSNTAVRCEWDKASNELQGTVFGESNDGRSGNINLVDIYRDTMLFAPDFGNFELYFNNPRCSISLNLSTEGQTDLYRDQMVEDYVADVKKKSINPIDDMEKDVYYPVIRKNNVLTDVYKIKINLHFRQHRGENWIADADSYWNGVCVKDNKVTLMDNFFSYSNKEEQSDLLTYLNFTNSDVRYQKSKLKKSFLRLLFYDSPNPAKQNLLAYSTVFYNTGEFFTKYVKHSEEKPYRTVNDNDEATEGLSGIKVDREPSPSMLPANTDNDEIEEYRLSSQFVILDKYNSKSSSEGFYLYLWRDILSKLIEGETNADNRKKTLKDGLNLYMKVEFNHAGYGRIIPFMMPYWDKKKHVGTTPRVKTFNDIINDWNSNDDGKYGARQYMKYSHICLRCGYDEDKKKYIYYLDNDVYGDDCTGHENNTIILNLYEAKMV